MSFDLTMTTQTTTIWFVYMLECLNGKIYTGITTDVETRFKKHCSGKGAKFTKINPPSHILATKPCENHSEASKLEYQVKELSSSKKRVLSLTWNQTNNR